LKVIEIKPIPYESCFRPQSELASADQIHKDGYLFDNIDVIDDISYG